MARLRQRAMNKKNDWNHRQQIDQLVKKSQSS